VEYLLFLWGGGFWAGIWKVDRKAAQRKGRKEWMSMAFFFTKGVILTCSVVTINERKW